MVVFQSSITALPPDQDKLAEALEFYLRNGEWDERPKMRKKYLRMLSEFKKGVARRDTPDKIMTFNKTRKQKTKVIKEVVK